MSKCRTVGASALLALLMLSGAAAAGGGTGGAVGSDDVSSFCIDAQTGALIGTTASLRAANY
jgi:hypothetical protein